MGVLLGYFLWLTFSWALVYKSVEMGRQKMITQTFLSAKPSVTRMSSGGILDKT